MSIIVGHSVPGAVLGNAAEQAAAAVARRDNILKSLQAAQEQQQFLANLGQQQAQAQQQAYQFEANRQDDQFAAMMEAYNKANAHRENMARYKMQQDQAAQEQRNFDSKHQLDREQFQYQQQEGAQRNQVYRDRQVLDDQQFLGQVQGGIKQRLAAGLNGSLVGPGQQKFNAWQSQLDAIHEKGRTGEFSTRQYTDALQKHAATYDSLGLDLYHKPPPPPQEQFNSMIVTDKDSGKRGYLKPTAHGHEFVPFEDGKAEKPVFDHKAVMAAQMSLMDQKVQKKIGEKNPDGSLKTEAQARLEVTPPTPQEIAAYLHSVHTAAELANQMVKPKAPPPQTAPEQAPPAVPSQGGPASVPSHEPLPVGVSVYTGGRGQNQSQVAHLPPPQSTQGQAPPARKPLEFFQPPYDPSAPAEFDLIPNYDPSAPAEFDLIPNHDPSVPGKFDLLNQQRQAPQDLPTQAPPPQSTPEQAPPAVRNPFAESVLGRKLADKYEEHYRQTGDRDAWMKMMQLRNGHLDPQMQDPGVREYEINKMVREGRIRGTKDDPIPVDSAEEAKKYPGKIVVTPDGRLKVYEE